MPYRQQPIGQTVSTVPGLLRSPVVDDAIYDLMRSLRNTRPIRLRLFPRNIYYINHRFSMSTKTIEVLDDADLRDGEMYVLLVLNIQVFISPINRTGRKSVSKMERFFYLVWATRYTQLVHIVPTTERPLSKVS